MGVVTLAYMMKAEYSNIWYLYNRDAACESIYFVPAAAATMMWDVFLYMCFFYWLMNDAVQANGLPE